jgi:hypothetical protein
MGVDVELPEGGAGIEREVLVLLLGELELPAGRGVLEDGLVGSGDLGVAGALEPERGVEADRRVEVGDVDARRPEPAGDLGHRGSSAGSAGSTRSE